MPKKHQFHDIANHTFGNLTALYFIGYEETHRNDRPGPYRHPMWIFSCSCGTQKSIRAAHVVNGSTKSCGCQKHTWHEDRLVPSLDLVKKQLERQYFYSARDRGLELHLTRDIIWDMSQQLCYWCGALPSNKIKPQGRDEIFLYNGIDRLDSSLGYVNGNVVTCCLHCNLAKSDYTISEFRDWIRQIYSHQFPNEVR